MRCGLSIVVVTHRSVNVEVVAGASANALLGSNPCFSRVLHDAELTGAEGGLGAIADVEFGQDVGTSFRNMKRGRRSGRSDGTT